MLLRAQQREHGQPWLEVGTVAELLELAPERMPELGAALAPDAPLCRWALIERDEGEVELPLVSARIKIATRLAQHLVGNDRLPEGLSLQVAAPATDEALRVASAPLARRVARALEAGDGLVVEIVGRPNTGRARLAGAIAEAAGRPLVTLDLAHGDAARRLAWRLGEAGREAELHRALLCLRNWDAALVSSAGRDEGQGAPPTLRMPPELARFFEQLDTVVLLVAEERQPLAGLHAPMLVHAEIPFPTPSERARLLAESLQKSGLEPAPDIDLASIMRRFALDPRRIEVAAREAAELTFERDAQARTVGHAELVEGCRHQLRHDLKSLAVRVDTSHKWEDLVIPVDVYDSLVEMIDYVRHAHRVYEQWGFAGRHSLSEGVSALFAGPPGTGKTMCASVMARELDMELFRVDLSRVVSKWIGETEKNLSKVFDEAQHSNAIILFDEADSLFAKRTEVKSSVDRYANLEVNYLLQRMEAFGGVTLLTTNFEDTIDTAFKRRLTFRMRFEKPDAEARAALWRKVFPSACALSADFDADMLGRMFEMSGGNIRNAAVRAAFFAAANDTPVDQATCLRAAEREAREMGFLTHALPRVVASDGDGDDEPPAPPPSMPEPPPPAPRARTIAITHPRKR
jgi:hypothetical protein